MTQYLYFCSGLSSILTGSLALPETFDDSSDVWLTFETLITGSTFLNTINETFNIYEEKNILAKIYQNNLLKINDNIRLNVDMKKQDNFKIIDTISIIKNYIKTIDELYNFSDMKNISVNISKTDNTNYDDFISYVAGIIVYIYENLALIDEKNIQSFLYSSDFIKLSDNLYKASVFIKNNIENFNFTDEVKKEFQSFLNDKTLTLENFNLSASYKREFFDTLSEEEIINVSRRIYEYIQEQFKTSDEMTSELLEIIIKTLYILKHLNKNIIIRAKTQ